MERELYEAVRPKGFHFGVRCDECDGGLRGFRYKCSVCPDYDLCEACQIKGTHPEHTMSCIPSSITERMALNDLASLKSILGRNEVKINGNLGRIEWKAGEDPLHLASKMGRNELIRVMVEAGLNINSHSVGNAVERATSLHWAVLCNQASSVKLLLELGADRSLQGKFDVLSGTPQNWASRLGYNDIWTVLEEHKDQSIGGNIQGASSSNVHHHFEIFQVLHPLKARKFLNHMREVTQVADQDLLKEALDRTLEAKRGLGGDFDNCLAEAIENVLEMQRQSILGQTGATRSPGNPPLFQKVVHMAQQGNEAPSTIPESLTSFETMDAMTKVIQKPEKEKELEEGKMIKREIEAKNALRAKLNGEMLSGVIKARIDKAKLLAEKARLQEEMRKVDEKVRNLASINAEKSKSEEIKLATLAAEIKKLEEQPSFRHMDLLEKQLAEIERMASALRGIILPKQPDSKKNNCPICLASPRQVFSCQECENWVCQGCRNRLVTCATCRQDLITKPLRRNRTVERMMRDD